MEEKPAPKDTPIAIIVIIAGLLTGVVLTYAFLKPEEPEPLHYSPEYRVADSQGVPVGGDDTAEPVEEEPASTPSGEQEDAEAGGVETGSESDGSEDRAAAASPSEEGAPVPHEQSTASERKTIQEARERMRAQGVEDYVELTEELYIRVSAKMVVMAAVLGRSSDEDVNPAEVQSLLADNAAEVLARDRIDPEDFWSFTRDVHSDPERAEQIGEKILREAEKHTEYTITFDDVPGLEPTPVPGTQ